MVRFPCPPTADSPSPLIAPPAWQEAVFLNDRSAARREFGSLLAGTSATLAVSLLVDRGQLRVHSSSVWRGSFNGTPVIVLLRLLRTVLTVGSASLLVWLLVLATLTMMTPKRHARLLRRVPFGRLIQRAISASVVLALGGPILGFAGGVQAAGIGAAGVASAPAVTDSSGGQRWPVLPRQAQQVGRAGAVALERAALGELASATTSGPTTVSTTRPGRTSGPTTRLPPTTPPPQQTHQPRGLPTADVKYGPAITVAFAAPEKLPPVPLAVAVRPHAAKKMDLTEHAVRAGESFWSIAEQQVLTATDEATDADVSRYWLELIAENRSRLPDPHNPDLLWVDMVLLLPPIRPVTPHP